MHSIFFGGMSQYYYQNGNLIQDDLVPFVKTISRLTRDAFGNLTEYQLPIEMPSLKGASAEFIPNLDLPHYANKVFKANQITPTKVLAGHIYGGINSPSLNPFSNNQTNNTNADNTIYEVWLTKTTPTTTNEYKIDGQPPYEVSILPNPFDKEFSVTFNTKHSVKVGYFISNSAGQIIKDSPNELYNSGLNSINITLDHSQSSGLYHLTLVFDNKHYISKKIIKI